MDCAQTGADRAQINYCAGFVCISKFCQTYEPMKLKFESSGNEREDKIFCINMAYSIILNI